MRNWFATQIKTRLDRRYATAASVGSLQKDVQRLSDAVARHEAAAPDIGTRFVGKEDPVELRKKLFDAHRLAIESARSIETILQEEIRIWQAIDAQAGPTSDAGGGRLEASG